jgi:hypothetical protein
VNKKKQKNLWAVGVVGDTGSGPAEPKVFAPLFSKSGYFLCLEAGCESQRLITTGMLQALPGSTLVAFLTVRQGWS